MKISFPLLNAKRLQILFYVFLVIGLVMRIHQHFMGRSLWEDEAHLSLNFMYFGYRDLMKPLENFQAAPILFLFTVETFTKIFGYSEVALRSFPFIVSTLVYPLYYFFVRDLTGSRSVALLSFIFVTFNVMLIEMASEVKPYTLDVSCYIGMGYLAVSEHEFVKRNRVLLLSLFGSLAMLYTNTSVMILAFTGFYIVHRWKANKESGQSWSVSFPVKDLYIFLSWGVVFLLNYFTFIHDHPYSDGMKGIWSFTFPPTNNEELLGFIKTRINDTFFNDLMFITGDILFPYVLLVIFTAAIGYIIYHRKLGIAIFTIIPVILHFVLATLKVYPFFYRFILYLLPSFSILLALGIVFIVKYLFEKMYNVSAIVFLCVCCLFILKKPVTMFPKWDREIKPSFRYINENHPNTKIFVTTPHTLVQFYARTGYLKNNNYQPIAWNATAEQYFDEIKQQKSNYLLVHSDGGNADGYQTVREALKTKNLVVKEFSYKTYAVWEVRPLPAVADSTTVIK